MCSCAAFRFSAGLSSLKFSAGLSSLSSPLVLVEWPLSLSFSVFSIPPSLCLSLSCLSLFQFFLVGGSLASLLALFQFFFEVCGLLARVVVCSCAAFKFSAGLSSLSSPLVLVEWPLSLSFSVFSIPPSLCLSLSCLSLFQVFLVGGSLASLLVLFQFFEVRGLLARLFQSVCAARNFSAGLSSLSRLGALLVLALCVFIFIWIWNGLLVMSTDYG